jgi:hypothetical protein
MLAEQQRHKVRRLQQPHNGQTIPAWKASLMVYHQRNRLLKWVPLMSHVPSCSSYKNSGLPLQGDPKESMNSMATPKTNIGLSQKSWSE